MHELLHHVDFLERLVDLKRVHVDLLQSVGAVLVVPDEVDAAEAALANDVHRFVLLHISNNNHGRSITYHAIAAPCSPNPKS